VICLRLWSAQKCHGNKTAERVLRHPVVGRKNYYGSGSVWSAHLAP